MTREDAIKRLKELADSSDIEAAHVEADEILANFLLSLGYEDLVGAWGRVPKFYA